MNALRCVPILLMGLGLTPVLGWLHHLEMEPARMADKIARLERENAEIDSVLTIILRRVHTTNEEVIQDVLADRLSLLAAAARIRSAGAEVPSWARPKLERLFPGNSDNERQCRRVIALIKGELKEEPGRRYLIVGRLEAELHEHLLRHGCVRLPEIDSAQAQSALVPGVLQ
jgi:hypothetical protein